MSVSGQVHIVIAGVVSLLTFVALGVTSTAAIVDARFHSYGVFSACCLAFQVVSGCITALAALKLHPYLGVAERITIGTYLIWTIVSCSLVAYGFFS